MKGAFMATDLITDISFLEAPASWNTKYITPAGFICQITLRGENGKDLLEKAGIALTYLIEHQYLPDNGFHKNGNGDGKLCPIHQCEMKKREKDGKTWYSHKTEDGSWCYGRKAKKEGSHE
jgi:hypothetical protein